MQISQQQSGRQGLDLGDRGIAAKTAGNLVGDGIWGQPALFLMLLRGLLPSRPDQIESWSPDAVPGWDLSYNVEYQQTVLGVVGIKGVDQAIVAGAVLRCF